MGNNIHTKNLKMRAFAAAMLAVSVLADGHLPSDDQFGLISPKPDMGDQDKMDKLSEMISTFCEGIEYDEDKHDDHMDDHEKNTPTTRTTTAAECSQDMKITMKSMTVMKATTIVITSIWTMQRPRTLGSACRLTRCFLT